MEEGAFQEGRGGAGPGKTRKGEEYSDRISGHQQKLPADPGLRHFIFDRFLKNALFTAFRQYFFVKFPAFYCCMVLYIYLACVIIFL